MEGVLRKYKDWLNFFPPIWREKGDGYMRTAAISKRGYQEATKIYK